MTASVPRGNEFTVNTTTVGEQIGSSVAALADGRFIVTWTHSTVGNGEDLSGAAVRAQIFSADGSPSGSEFLVNTTTENDQLIRRSRLCRTAFRCRVDE